MELIQKNPYRIAGILSNATERELQRQKIKLRAYTKVGKEIQSAYDFQILDNVQRTEDSVNKAFADIEHNQDKINYTLFWFLNVSPFDDTAIEYLKNDDTQKAIEIWEKVTINKDVNSQNYSAFNNLGTCKLISKSVPEIKEGIEAKIKLIESEYFTTFVHAVADERFTIDNHKQIETWIDELLTQLKSEYSKSQALNLFSNCNQRIQKYLLQKFTEEPIHKIESQIESCKKKRKVNKGSTYQAGLNLFNNTKDDLSLLKSLLGTSNLKYKAAADQLANEIMQCGIEYFNKHQKNNSSEDYLRKAQKLNKTALLIAVGSLVRDRAKDHISTLEEINNREIYQVIQLLRSIKDAYKTSGDKILAQVRTLIASDPEFILKVKSIDEFAVKENILKSIDWEKVNHLISESIDDKIIHKIKHSSSKDLKEEFFLLISWLKKHNNTTSKSSTKIINTYNNIPLNLSFKILSSEVININKKPLYTKFKDDIRLRLTVEVAEEHEVTFCINRRSLNFGQRRHAGFLDSMFYQTTKNPLQLLMNLKSWFDDTLKVNVPKYYYSVTKTLNEKSIIIDLPCTDGSNLKKVEVYIDDELIHTETFKLEIAPSEKIGKELSDAEKKLKQINDKSYYETEINDALNEMSEIQKFKWFRLGSKKQSQIQSQQTKIDLLIHKSKDEKKRDIKIQEEIISKLKMDLSLAKY